MRIIIAVDDFRPGGISTYILNVGRALLDQGHNVRILATEPFGEMLPEIKQSLPDLIVRRRLLESGNGFVQVIVNEINSFDPDVVVNNAHWVIQAAFPYLKTKVYTISVVHSIIEREIDIAVSCRAYTNRIVSVSKNVKALVDARLKNSEVKPESILLPVGIPVQASTCVEKKIRNPKLRILYVGRLAKEKNIPGIIRIIDNAFKRKIPLTVTFIGDGAEMRELRKWSLNCTRPDDVEITGFLPPEKISEYYKTYDVLVLASHFEGTPHSLLEGMSYGLIPIASRISGSTDTIITHRENGFLCDRNAPDAFCDAFAEVWSDVELKLKMANNAKSFVEKHYAIDFIARRLLPQQPAFESASGAACRLEGCKVEVPSDIERHCPGLLRQIRHRVADLIKVTILGKKMYL